MLQDKKYKATRVASLIQDQTCPECNGAGFYEDLSLSQALGISVESYDKSGCYVTCTYCGGSGKMKELRG